MHKPTAFARRFFRYELRRKAAQALRVAHPDTAKALDRMLVLGQTSEMLETARFAGPLGEAFADAWLAEHT